MPTFTITLNKKTTAAAINCVEKQLEALGGTPKYDGKNRIKATAVKWRTDPGSLSTLEAKLNDDCKKVNDNNPPVAKVVSG